MGSSVECDIHISHFHFFGSVLFHVYVYMRCVAEIRHINLNTIVGFLLSASRSSFLNYLQIVVNAFIYHKMCCNRIHLMKFAILQFILISHIGFNFSID